VARRRSEIALRLPSTFALAWAVLLLYRLGSELFDHRIGLLAAIGFALHPGVAFAASDARPYAIALAFTVASVLALVRWLRHGRLLDAASYVLATTVMIYAHYLFGVMLLVHAVYALWPARPRGPVSPRALCIAAGLLVVAVAPLTLQLVSIARRSADFSFAPEASLALLLRVLAPTIIPFSILLARDRFRRLGVGSRLSDLILLLSWSVVPPALLFAITLESDFRASLAAISALRGGTTVAAATLFMSIVDSATTFATVVRNGAESRNGGAASTSTSRTVGA